MKRKTLNLAFYWLLWPLIFMGLNNTSRTRLLLRSGDKVLLTEGWISDGRWGLPGGGLGRGEQPVDGLIREVKEETGLDIDPGVLRELGEEEVKDRGISYRALYYSARIPGLLPVKARKEIKKAEWVRADDLNSENSVPEVIAALRLSREG